MDPPTLDRLSRACADCLHLERRDACEPCRELLRRAICDRNDAAWDVVVVSLWPLVLHWLYSTRPGLTPATAERLGCRAVGQFRRHSIRRWQRAASFPTFQTLMADLRLWCVAHTVCDTTRTTDASDP